MSADRLHKSPVQNPQAEGLLFGVPHGAHPSRNGQLQVATAVAKEVSHNVKAGAWGNKGAFLSFANYVGELCTDFTCAIQ